MGMYINVVGLESEDSVTVIKLLVSEEALIISGAQAEDDSAEAQKA